MRVNRAALLVFVGAMAFSSMSSLADSDVCAPGRGFIELEYAVMMQEYGSAAGQLPPVEQVNRQVVVLNRLKDRLTLLWRARAEGSLSAEDYDRRVQEALFERLESVGRFQRVASNTFVADAPYSAPVDELVQLVPGGDLVRFCVFAEGPAPFSGFSLTADPARTTYDAEMLSCSVLELATGEIHGTEPLGSQMLAQTGPEFEGVFGEDGGARSSGFERAIRYRALLNAAVSMGRDEYVRRRLAGEFGSVCDPINQVQITLSEEDDVDWRRLFPLTLDRTGENAAAPRAE